MTFTSLLRSQVRVSFRNPSVSKGHGSDAETTTDTFGNPGLWLSGVVVEVDVVVVVTVVVEVVGVVLDGKPAIID